MQWEQTRNPRSVANRPPLVCSVCDQSRRHLYHYEATDRPFRALVIRPGYRLALIMSERQLSQVYITRWNAQQERILMACSKPA